MHSLRRRGAIALALCVAIMAVAATSAPAQTITPPSTPITGTATPVTFAVDGGPVGTCASSSISFVTPPPSSLPSVSTAGSNVTFNGCNVAGLAATVTSDPVTPWTATVTKFLDPMKTSWEFSITTGRIVIQVAGVCTLTVPPGNSIKGVYTNNTTSFMISGSIVYMRTGSALCGPASGSITFTGTYTLKPKMTVT